MDDPRVHEDVRLAWDVLAREVSAPGSHELPADDELDLTDRALAGLAADRRSAEGALPDAVADLLLAARAPSTESVDDTVGFAALVGNLYSDLPLARAEEEGRREPSMRSRFGLLGRALAAKAAVVTGMTVVGVAGVLALPAFGLHPAVVASGSMAPALRTGDLVIVRDVTAADLVVDDIARIDLSGDGGTTHRVVSLGARADTLIVTTRGDANAATEEWQLARDLVVGVVEVRVPWIGWLLSRIATAMPRDAVVVSVTAVAVALLFGARRARR